MTQGTAINGRQLEVLRWIGAGCPDREWPDYTHRISARSLTTRGLVTIRGHGPSWTAAITDSGRAYLELGPSRPEPESRPTSSPEVDPASGRASPWWADRNRWTLDSRLAQALEAAEDWCTGERQRLDDAEKARQERHQRWEAAVPKARRAHADAVNARRADAQLAALSRAVDLRSYADAIEARAQLAEGDQRDPAKRWATWLRQEADRVDPLMHPGELQYREPEKPSVSDLDEFMPPGMTVAKPPK